MLEKTPYRGKNIFVLFLLTILVCISPVTFSQQYSIRDILFEGNSKTKTTYLQRFIKTQAGEIPDSLQITNDLRKLRSLAPVMDASAFISESDSGSLLIYSIHERYTMLPVGDFGITNDNFWIGGGLMESNLRGKGLYVYGYYQYNSRHTVHLIYRNPYLFASQWGYELHLRHLPSNEHFNDTSFILNKYFDLSLAVRYEFRYENEVTAGTSVHHQLADNREFIDTEVEPEIYVERFAQTFFLKHEIRNLDYRSFHVKGWKNLVSLSCQVPYNLLDKLIVIFYNELRYYVRYGHRGNLAIRLMAGISNEKEKLFYPFLADSYYSFRGIGYRAFRGNAIGLLNLEYRHTCFENHIGGIQFVGFTDAGIIPQLEAGSQEPQFYKPGQLFAGPGIRIIYKKAYNAILTIDYGFDILHGQQGGLVIGWGQYF